MWRVDFRLGWPGWGAEESSMKAAAVWKSLVFPVGAVLAKRRASVVIGGDSSRDCAP